MDTKTLEVYNQQAPTIVARHLAYGNHDMLFGSRVLAFFRPGEPTADIGSGSGRDTHWLHQQGFPVVGYDASEGMMAEARHLYPECEFLHALLPDLAGVPSNTYTNVLCSFVLMHLPATELPKALANLVRILKSDGWLIVAYRHSKTESKREADGRLFTPISLEQMQVWMEQVALRVLVAESHQSSNDPAFHWYLLVGERSPVNNDTFANLPPG
jgi:ubiquinone/menaquinone biosynthesis C-methylase UbiE